MNGLVSSMEKISSSSISLLKEFDDDKECVIIFFSKCSEFLKERSIKRLAYTKTFNNCEHCLTIVDEVTSFRNSNDDYYCNIMASYFNSYVQNYKKYDKRQILKSVLNILFDNIIGEEDKDFRDAFSNLVVEEINSDLVDKGYNINTVRDTAVIKTVPQNVIARVMKKILE